MSIQVQLFNNIAESGLAVLEQAKYLLGTEMPEPDLIMLRSHDLHAFNFNKNLKAVGRAGVGVNNVPVEKLTKLGIPVFNAPGANANAVKELVIASMIMACRNLSQALEFSRQLQGDDSELAVQSEKGKKQFSGFELMGRTLGVVGLGAIGVQVANTAMALGMNVIGFDPVISVRQAWQLDAQVERADSLAQLMQQADFVTIHVPLNDHTKNMIDAEQLSYLKADSVLLNFARGPIVNTKAVIDALDKNNLYVYMNDFPCTALQFHPKVVSFPHLGASTSQSEENCAVMVATQLKEFIETGNIRNAVNFPEVSMPWTQGERLSIVNQNIPNMVGQITSVLGEHNINVIDLINKSKGDIAYTMIDTEQVIADDLLAKISDISGIISARKISRA